MIEFIVLAVCLIGASYKAYKIGVKEGAEKVLVKLHETKIIAFDDKGEIKPNPFYFPPK